MSADMSHVEEWAHDRGIALQAGRKTDDGGREWRVEIPDDAQVRVSMTVHLPDGTRREWGGGNIPGEYILQSEPAQKEEINDE